MAEAMGRKEESMTDGQLQAGVAAELSWDAPSATEVDDQILMAS